MGSLATVLVPSDDRAYMLNAFQRNAFRGADELVVLDVVDARPYCGALGCGGGQLAQSPSSALFQNAFTIAQQADTVSGNSTEAVIAHELGHAVGLCHCTSPIMSELTLIGTSAIAGIARLSGPELAAIRSVYGAGLGPGSTKQALMAAGLVGN